MKKGKSQWHLPFCFFRKCNCRLYSLIDGGYGARFTMGQLYDQKRQIGFECMRVIQQLFSGRSAARIAYPDSVARPDDPTSAPRSIGLWDVVRQLEAELERMKHEESQIDIDLEMIKSKGLALGNQAQEYQKYTADGLKTEFKNNYMA